MNDQYVLLKIGNMERKQIFNHQNNQAGDVLNSQSLKI